MALAVCEPAEGLQTKSSIRRVKKTTNITPSDGTRRCYEFMTLILFSSGRKTNNKYFSVKFLHRK